MRKRRERPMAIQPIDLQALFSQLGNVGKTQAAIRDGQQMQAALQQAQAQQKLEENVRSVNEAQEMGKDAGTIKDQKGSGANQGGAHKGKPQKEETPPKDEKSEIIRNPALGRNIDISG